MTAPPVEGEGGRALAVEQPGPERVEHRLDAGRGARPRAPSRWRSPRDEEPVGEADLHAFRGRRGRARRRLVAPSSGKSEREAGDEGDARCRGRSPPVVRSGASASARQPSHRDHQQGVEEPGSERDSVAERRARGGGDGRCASRGRRGRARLPDSPTNGRSRRRIGSPSSSGASSSTQIGAVDCRKIAAAAVVHFVAVTKATKVAA